jgi:hypothetical protein
LFGVGTLLRFKDVAVDGFDAFRFLIRKRGELILAAPAWNPPTVLAHEHDKVLRQPVGHVHDLHDAAACLILAAQEIDFVREVVVDGARDAAIKELRLCCAVEVAVEVAGVKTRSLPSKTASNCSVPSKVTI